MSGTARVAAQDRGESEVVASALPQAWPLVPLGALCEPQTGVRNPADLGDDTFFYVDISAVDNQRKEITEPQILRGHDAPSRARNVIHARDVLVATTRPNLNAVAMVPEELHDQVCSTGFCVLRAGTRVLPEFLFAFVRSPMFIEPLTDLVKGALYPAVNNAQVLALKIPLPPIAEQERIARQIKVQFTCVEQARTAALSRLSAAQALPAAYSCEVFEGSESSTWKMVRLGDICEGTGQYGTSVRSNNLRGGLPVLGMSHIHQGRIRWHNVSHVALSPEDEEKYRLQIGDVLFNRTNSAELVGKTAVFDGARDAVFASYLIRFRVREGLADPHFVSSFINSRLGRVFIERHMARASGQVNISASTMAEMPVPCPSIDVHVESLII